MLSSEKKNQMIIRELTHFTGMLAANQGDIEQAVGAINKRFPAYAKTLAAAAAEIRAAIAMNKKIIAVLNGEDRELEREREELLRDATRYAAGILRSIAER